MINCSSKLLRKNGFVCQQVIEFAACVCQMSKRHRDGIERVFFTQRLFPVVAKGCIYRKHLVILEASNSGAQYHARLRTKAAESSPSAKGRRNFGSSSSAREPTSYEPSPGLCPPEGCFEARLEGECKTVQHPLINSCSEKLESNTGPTRLFDLGNSLELKANGFHQERG